MVKTINIISIKGKVDKDIHGSWDDVDRGFWVGDDHIEAVLCRYLGKEVSIIIELLDNNNEEGDIFKE